MKRKAMVGVLPLWDEARESYWMLPGYMNGLLDAGVVPVMLPMTSDKTVISRLTEVCDGFLFTGGQDVSPEVYHSTVKFNNVECCEERDVLELVLLEKALKEDKPVLGICRGIQLMNAALGGTLYQDIPCEYGSHTEHHQKPPYDVPAHTVQIVKDSPLYRLLGKEKLAVNSYHHQAVKCLSDRLLVMARAEDGLTEAVYMPDKKFVWGIQWHPEFSYRNDENCRKIFEQFAACCET